MISLESTDQDKYKTKVPVCQNNIINVETVRFLVLLHHLWKSTNRTCFEVSGGERIWANDGWFCDFSSQVNDDLWHAYFVKNS